MAQLLGKKVGKGFYLYSQDKATKFNPEVAKFISKTPSELSEEVILDRIIFSMVNEASRCLEEKVITRADYLDMALLMGLGFPPFRGGLLRYADERGVDQVVKRLDSFQEIYGARFAPSALLRTMAAQHKTFYS
jgi:3-hydroxyacyl-CoA dehydrogenase/enoyl-CoA hydratase/3-hydroxybutyryl-CoA epimerase